jgi:hypothetical protein
MEFREFASTEATALVGRLRAQQSDASLQQLRRVREALEAAEHALDSPSKIDKDIREFVGKLVNAAGAAMRHVREEAKAALDTARGELTTERAECEKLADALKDLQARSEELTEALRKALEKERERAEAADRDLMAARAANAELDAARQKAEDLLDAAFSDGAKLSAQLDEETAATFAIRSELAGVRQELEAAHAKAKEVAAQETAAKAALKAAADRDLSEARKSLEAAMADMGRLGAQLEASAAEKGKVIASLSATQGELHTAHEQREAFAAQLKASQARVQTLERAQAQHAENLKQLERKVSEAGRAEVTLREQVASQTQESAARKAEIAALSAETERARALFDAGVRGFDDLAAATTVSGLLAALAKQLATQFARVAVFRVKGNRLEGEHQIGFDQTSDVSKLVIPLNMDSLLTRAVHTGAVESLTGRGLADAGGTPLAGTPSMAVALPIMFHSRTIAVVYADDSSQRAPAKSAAPSASTLGFAKLMLGQAGVLLLRLTHELKTLAELRDYATQLLQEAEQMHSADAAAGKGGDELRRRLNDTLDCARQLYAQRAALEGAAAAGLFDEQVAASIDGQTTPFAKDLAAVVGRSRGTGSRRAAEAS